MRLLGLAGIDVVTLNTFSWAALQPDENTYHFEKLDKIMDLAEINGLKVCLATSTAAHPAWMAKRHPDVLRTDFYGRKRKFGGRHNSCQNSPAYRKYSVLLSKNWPGATENGSVLSVGISAMNMVENAIVKIVKGLFAFG